MNRKPAYEEPLVLKSMNNTGASHTRTDAAFFLQDLSGGGAEKIMAGLANEFVKRGLKVDFVLVQASGVNLKFLSEKIQVVDLEARNTYLCLPALIRYLNETRPRAFLSSLDLTNLMALIARKLSRVNVRLVIRIEVMVSAQKRPYIKKRLERLLLTALYPWADDIIAISRNVAEDIIRYARLSPNKVHAVSNPGVTPDLLNKAREDAGHAWLRKGQPPVVLGAGRLTEQKDFATLINAFARLHKKTEVRLIILGEGEQKPELEALVRRLGIESDVDLHGYVENPYSFLRQSRVFVLSSKWEGSPSVVIAALACGCPVISTDCPGAAREILADGAYGDLVPVGDAAAMAEAMEKVLENGGKRVAPHWLDQFSIENITDQTIEILRLS
jgi:glycosyltransferase involved in cell wall biosynthesis